MQTTIRRYWPAIKVLLTLAILGFIGWRFWKDLSSEPELFRQPLVLPWLIPASLCYLGGLSLSALYWRRLMGHLEQPAPLMTTFRAYFVGQLGKYVPGKALALVMRAALMRGAGTSVGLAGLTAFYEVLVTMAAGASVALLLFALTPLRDGEVLGYGEGIFHVLRLHVPDGERIDRLTLILFSLGLLTVLMVFIYPAVLNRLVKRITMTFRLGSAPLLQRHWLGEGLAITAPSWLLLGLALACALQTAGVTFDLTPATVAYLIAVMALGYVAGFFVPVPGAVGVREFFLYELLASAAPGQRGQIVLAVLLLRLAWTIAEMILACALYFLPGERVQSSNVVTTIPTDREQVA